MVDPSFLFAPDGLEWLEAQPGGMRELIILPRTFQRALAGAVDLDLSALIAEEDAVSGRRQRVEDNLASLATFSYEAAVLPPELEIIRNQLSRTTSRASQPSLTRQRYYRPSSRSSGIS
jgi:hypothetical protein